LLDAIAIANFVDFSILAANSTCACALLIEAKATAEAIKSTFNGCFFIFEINIIP
jgi:hypothetical protein